MSLNKLKDLQLGHDLGLQIGCVDLLADEATISNAFLNVVDATTVSTAVLNVGGTPFDPFGTSNLQSVGMNTKNVASVDVETDIFPTAYLGSIDGEFPANSLKIGDTISIDSFLQLQGAPGSVLDLRLYNATGTILLASIIGMDMASFATLSDARLQISISIRDTLACHVNGTFSGHNFADQSSKTWGFTAQTALFDIGSVNKLRITAQWSAGHIGSTLSQQQLTYTRKSVAQIE
jgi:hypothetical protein